MVYFLLQLSLVLDQSELWFAVQSRLCELRRRIVQSLPPKALGPCYDMTRTAGVRCCG